MDTIEFLRGLFERREVPAEARRIFEESKTPHEIIEGLEDALGRARAEYDRYYDELQELDGHIEQALARLRMREVRGTAEDRLMDDLALRQQRQARLKRTVRRLHGDLSLIERMIGSVQEAQSVGVSQLVQDDIDGIAERWEAAVAEHTLVMKAGEDSEPAAGVDPEADERAREERRRQLLGEPASDAPAADAPSRRRNRELE